jgi:hypothetical protein
VNEAHKTTALSRVGLVGAGVVAIAALALLALSPTMNSREAKPMATATTVRDAAIPAIDAAAPAQVETATFALG